MPDTQLIESIKQPIRTEAVVEILRDDPPDETRQCMDFTLVYWDTTLKAAGGNTRAWEKHHIRRYFSPQLETLWNTSPVLRMYDSGGQVREALAQRFTRNGTEFVPLVMADLGLVCDLDIIFLRPEAPGKLVTEGGDIDNRVKVLLDALRIPADTSEMYMKPGEPSPKRVYCLLENDTLITSIKVTTDRLLVRETPDRAEACLTIRTTVRGIHPSTPYEFRS